MSRSSDKLSLEVIAHLRSDFSSKFGIPRQSGLIDALQADIVFEPQYRQEAALRGLEGYSHLWLLWHFSQNKRDEAQWSATVRPPRLGGNTRMGVFATRSPYRPNPIGLSCVRLAGISWHTPQGPVLHVCGADLLDGTPIFDIKPYLPYVDAHPEALDGCSLATGEAQVQVEFPDALLAQIPASRRQALLEVLAQDPRPGYQEDPERRYGMAFAGFDVRFTVKDGVLRVFEVRAEEGRTPHG